MPISYGGDNITFPDASTQNTSPKTGFVNRIINGGMTIDQRNGGAAITTTGFVVDRFLSLQPAGYTTLTVSAQQVSDAAPNFNNSIKVTVGTGQAVSASGNLLGADHRIEGFNFADFGFGTANAQPFTLSFWVKSSIVGTYPVSFFNSGVSRAYLATYTISVANTWEKKTITIAGDTSGTWNTTNGIGLGMQFSISSGSNSFGTPGSWSGTYKAGVSGMPDVGATSGATFYITGVQLEKGSTATPFEFRSYGDELALCERYCQQVAFNIYIGNGTSYYWSVPINLQTSMRAAPTVGTLSGGSTSAISAEVVENFSAQGFRYTILASGVNAYAVGRTALATVEL